MAQAILFSFLPRPSAAAQRSQDSWAAARPATHAASKRIADLRTVARIAPGSSRDRRAGCRTGSRWVASSKGTDASCPSVSRLERQPATAQRRVAQHPHKCLRRLRPNAARREQQAGVSPEPWVQALRRRSDAWRRCPGGCFTGGRLRSDEPSSARSDQMSRPAMAAQTKVAMLPPTMALRPRRARSPRRSGARPAMPPIWMAMELKLAKPHRA